MEKKISQLYHKNSNLNKRSHIGAFLDPDKLRKAELKDLKNNPKNFNQDKKSMKSEMRHSKISGAQPAGAGVYYEMEDKTKYTDRREASQTLANPRSSDMRTLLIDQH